MSDKAKILYVCQELMPYLPETEVSSLCRMLPQYIQEKGRDIRTFMPRYGCINERRNQLHEVIRLSGMNIVIDDTDHQLIIKVASIPAARVQVYFIDSEDYFQRKYTLTDQDGKYFEDNDERSIFFSRGIMETVSKLRWSPDIVHCHGWFSSIVPAYIKRIYKDDPLFAKAKIVISLYGDDFPDKLDMNVGDKIVSEGVDPSETEILSDPTHENLLKFALSYADGVVVADSNVKSSVIEFAKEKGVEVLYSINDDNYVENYSQFYDRILEK